MLKFSQNVKKNKLKVLKFQNFGGLGSSSGIKKTVEGRKGKFIFFLSLLLSVHINFENKLKYHTSLFIATFYLFCSNALIIFSNLQFQWIFSLICYHNFTEYVSMSSPPGSAFFLV